MEAVIVNFRRGRDTQKDTHMILKVDGIDSKEKAAGKEIKGIVKSTHGNKGALRAIFEKGMPGQAIGAKVKVE